MNGWMLSSRVSSDGMFLLMKSEVTVCSFHSGQARRLFTVLAMISDARQKKAEQGVPPKVSGSEEITSTYHQQCPSIFTRTADLIAVEAHMCIHLYADLMSSL